MPYVSVGRLCLSTSAIIMLIATPIVDWNHTHLFNPRWPPHAKFHNGQTIATSMYLSLVVLYYTWRTPPITKSLANDDRSSGDKMKQPAASSRRSSSVTTTAAKDSIFTAAVCGSVYWFGALSAWFFPNAKAMDPEFGNGFPQLGPFCAGLALMVVGGFLEIRRLEKK